MSEEDEEIISLDKTSKLEKTLYKIKSFSKVIIFSFIEKFYLL
jgi:hypothetical protein